jgi:hypothetical protein
MDIERNRVLLGAYSVWRAIWDGDGKPLKQQTMKERIDFNEVVEEAHRYILWFKTIVQKTLWEPPEMPKLFDIPVLDYVSSA